jgi:RNA polymerase sigma-70 factor (ECF subfamily)
LCNVFSEFIVFKVSQETKTYPLSEKVLIERCIKNDEQAQRLLYDKYAKNMVAVCFRYCSDYETARDLMHDAFIKLFRNIGSYTGEGAFEAWMRKIVVNTSLEFLRKNDVLKYSLDIDDAVTVSDEQASVVEQLSEQEILKLIAELPHGFRTVFNLYAIEGYSHAEIAKMLNINEASSRSQFSRARVLLQKKILQNR